MITRTHTRTPSTKKSSTASARAKKEVVHKKPSSDAAEKAPDIQSESAI